MVKGVPHRLAPCRGVAGSRPASQRGACLVVRWKCGPECTWGLALSGAAAELFMVETIGSRGPRRVVGMLPCSVVGRGQQALFYSVKHFMQFLCEESAEFRILCGVFYLVPRGDSVVLSSEGEVYRYGHCLVAAWG